MGKASTRAKNKYNNANYDRIGIVLPKGTKELWTNEARRQNISLNAYIQQAVTEYIALHNEDKK